MSNKTSLVATLRPPSGSSLLDRADSSRASLSENQALIDQMISTSISEATQGSTLLAMFGAGAVSRLTRAGVMSLAIGEGGKILPIVIRGGSYAVALANESAAFAGIEKGFHPSQTPFEKDWARALINLASLKLLGGAAQGQNPILQHLLTDLGMVEGQQVGAQFGIVERPQGNFAQQMVQAEALNWSMKGGMALLQGLSPNLLPMERSIDFYLQSKDTDLFSKGLSSSRFVPQLLPEGPGLSSAESFEPEGAKGPEIAMMSHEGEGGKGESSPFSGIRYFQAIDGEQCLRFEEGRLGEQGYRLGQYWPRTGDYEFMEIVLGPGGEFIKQRFIYNERNGHVELREGGNIKWEKNLDEGDWAALIGRLYSLTAKIGVPMPNPRKPMGYPEVTDVVQRVVAGKSVDPESLKEGDFILFETGARERPVVFARVSRIKRIERKGDPLSYVIYSRGSDLAGDKSLELSVERKGLFNKKITVKKIDTKKYSMNLNQEENIIDTLYTHGIPVLPYESRWRKDTDPRRAWRISPEEAAQIMRFRPKVLDPIPGTQWTREQLTLYTALQSMAYERWGLDEVGLTSGLYGTVARAKPEHKAVRLQRYAGINPENYAKALDILIKRFGEVEFAKAVTMLFLDHLNGLHTQWHRPHSPYAPHSDIGPLGEEYTSVAKDAIKGLHPVPNNMTESGVLVNAKTLFGDRDFWIHMLYRYPSLFDQFVDFLKALPKDFHQKGIYGETLVDPIALIKQYFPHAFWIINAARPDFDSDTPEALRKP
jgi:hypothetical protein